MDEMTQRQPLAVTILHVVLGVLLLGSLVSVAHAVTDGDTGAAVSHAAGATVLFVAAVLVRRAGTCPRDRAG